jgi:hypothetical protein
MSTHTQVPFTRWRAELPGSFCVGRWDITAKFFYFTGIVLGSSDTYVLPVNPVRGILDFPSQGIGAEVRKQKGVTVPID